MIVVVLEKKFGEIPIEAKVLKKTIVAKFADSFALGEDFGFHLRFNCFPDIQSWFHIRAIVSCLHFIIIINVVFSVYYISPSPDVIEEAKHELPNFRECEKYQKYKNTSLKGIGPNFYIVENAALCVDDGAEGPINWNTQGRSGKPYFFVPLFLSTLCFVFKLSIILIRIEC